MSHHRKTVALAGGDGGEGSDATGPAVMPRSLARPYPPRRGRCASRRVAFRTFEYRDACVCVSTRRDHRSFLLFLLLPSLPFPFLPGKDVGIRENWEILKSRRRSLRHLCVRRSNSSSRAAIRGNVDTAIRHEMVSLSPLATGFDFEGMRSSTKTLRFEIRKWLLYEDDEDDEDTPFSRTGAECKWRGGGGGPFDGPSRSVCRPEAKGRKSATRTTTTTTTRTSRSG